MLKPEIFNSDYYGLFSDVANSTFCDCSYFFNRCDIDKEFEEKVNNDQCFVYPTRVRQLYKCIRKYYIQSRYGEKSSKKLAVMLGLVRKMKFQLKEYHKYLNEFIKKHGIKLGDYEGLEDLMFIFNLYLSKAELEEFLEDSNKNNEIDYGKIIKLIFSDLKYFKRLLKDDKKVVDLYVSSLNDDIKSVETLEEDKLKENVEKLYEIFCLDADLDKDEFHDKKYCSDANGFYDKDINEIYEKVVKIIKDFENSETFKKIIHNYDFIYHHNN